MGSSKLYWLIRAGLEGVHMDICTLDVHTPVLTCKSGAGGSAQGWRALRSGDCLGDFVGQCAGALSDPGRGGMSG